VVPHGGLELIPGVLLLCISTALLWWSVPQLKEVFLEQEKFVPTTHVSAGSDCQFGQKPRIEFRVDARRPTTVVLALRDIAPPSRSHPCEYIYIRFPGHIDNAYADALSGSMMIESKENIYEHLPGQRPLLGDAFLDASLGEEARFTITMKKLSEQVRSGDIYIQGELNAVLSSSSFADKIMHYWVRFPGSQIRNGCLTETECEEDYLADNPHIGVIDMIFARNLRVKSALLTKSAEALTREGLTRITTEDLTGAIFVEDRENARSRDVILLYAGTLFATGLAIGTDGILEFVRLALGSGRSDRIRRRNPAPLLAGPQAVGRVRRPCSDNAAADVSEPDR
jgi:hypothetical protein